MVADALVTDFGAAGDGAQDDAPAIQAALDSGAPRVVVPAGIYRLGAGLKIGSRTHLEAHPQAVFRMGDGVGRGTGDFLLSNRDPAGGDRDIRVEGGIWDGNNTGNPRGPDTPGSYTGVMMNFTGVSGLVLRDMTLLDAESYFVRLGRVRDFLVEDIRFDIKHLRPNQDGVHVSGHCEDGVLRRLVGLGEMAPNDDLAALVADDALHRAQNQGGAFNGTIRRVRVEHLRASSCHSFVRLLSVDHPIEDIEIHDVEGGCRCCAINMDACRLCRVQLFDEADRPEGVGAIRRVHISDVTVFKATDTSHQPLIDFRTRADEVVIERFARDGARDASPATPSLVIERAGALEVGLEGAGHPPEGAATAPYATPTGEELHRMTQRICHADRLALQRGGFAALRVRRADA